MYIHEHGYPPSYRDLCEVLYVKSPSMISDFLHKLSDRGYINWLVGQPRTLRIIKTAS
ncbi:transcriptional regulator [Bacillus sp. Bva_UNVM-123]